LRVPCHFVGQELESDEAVQARILRFVNDAHATATKLFNDAVVRDGLADHVRRGAFWSIYLMDEESHSQRKASPRVQKSYIQHLRGIVKEYALWS